MLENWTTFAYTNIDPSAIWELSGGTKTFSQNNENVAATMRHSPNQSRGRGTTTNGRAAEPHGF